MEIVSTEFKLIDFWIFVRKKIAPFSLLLIIIQFVWQLKNAMHTLALKKILVMNIRSFYLLWVMLNFCLVLSSWIMYKVHLLSLVAGKINGAINLITINKNK